MGKRRGVDNDKIGIPPGVFLENQVKMENFMKRKYRLFLCMLLSVPVLLLSGCDLPSRLNFGKTSGSGESISKSGFYFNTVITVTLYGTKDETLLDDCFSLADTYENYFSNTIADSDVSKINAAGGAPVTVHEETAELIKKGLYYGDLSNGKFDITIGKLSDLWDVSTKALLEKTDASMIPSDDLFTEKRILAFYSCPSLAE